MSQKANIQLKSNTPNPQFANVEDVSPSEVRELKASLKLIDVRRPDEWTGEYGHIPGAELMTLDTLPMRLNELNPEDTIIFICRSGARSAQAASFAKQNGFSSVFNMQGGMIAWTQANFETEDQNV
jgi:hydroxyacylglutathione hydrolase